jgi:hypothetical protein
MQLLCCHLVQAAQDAVLFSAHGGRMDPSKLFRNGAVMAVLGAASASDSDASQPAIVKLRPKLEAGSSLKPKVCSASPANTRVQGQACGCA